MAQFSINNIDKPTKPFWNKISLACMFVSSSITGTALGGDNHTMAWIGWSLTIVGGVIPILTNGVAPTPPNQDIK